MGSGGAGGRAPVGPPLRGRTQPWGEPMVGVVVRGGTSEPLAPLGVPADIAWAPFAARYRVWDFAHATLRNSGLDVFRGMRGESPEPAAHGRAARDRGQRVARLVPAAPCRGARGARRSRRARRGPARRSHPRRRSTPGARAPSRRRGRPGAALHPGRERARRRLRARRRCERRRPRRACKRRGPRPAVRSPGPAT